MLGQTKTKYGLLAYVYESQVREAHRLGRSLTLLPAQPLCWKDDNYRCNILTGVLLPTFFHIEHPWSLSFDSSRCNLTLICSPLLKYSSRNRGLAESRKDGDRGLEIPAYSALELLYSPKSLSSTLIRTSLKVTNFPRTWLTHSGFNLSSAHFLAPKWRRGNLSQTNFNFRLLLVRQAR